MTASSEYYMQLCLRLAEQALAAGNPPVGAVIVHETRVIGQGVESGRSSGDITNHAEILAVRDAVDKGHGDKLHAARMYTTHEPCIMCSYLIRHHRIPEIVFGASVPLVGGFTSEFAILKTESVPKWGAKPLVTSGVCAPECEALTARFIAAIATPKA